MNAFESRGSRLVLSLFGLIFAGALLFHPLLGVAQTTGTAQGLTISPFLLERQLNKGETLNDTIEVSNTTGRTLPISIVVEDFQPVGDNGQEQFLPAGQGDPRYSLSSWITIQNSPKLVLGPNERTNVDFSITPPADAEDGGHYGAIMFSFQGASVNGSAVQVTQQLGAILLVKLGKVTEDGDIAQFGPEHSFYEYPPVTFTTRFKNTGNVHVQPRGSINIYNMFGKETASVLVNPDALNVLPSSERIFPSTWTSGLGFGLYTAQEKLVYGDSGSLVTASASFWIVPWKIVLAIIIGLFLLLLILRWIIRSYNRRIIRRAYEMSQQRKQQQPPPPPQV